jgi:hypothetical protein
LILLSLPLVRHVTIHALLVAVALLFVILAQIQLLEHYQCLSVIALKDISMLPISLFAFFATINALPAWEHQIIAPYVQPQTIDKLHHLVHVLLDIMILVINHYVLHAVIIVKLVILA